MMAANIAAKMAAVLAALGMDPRARLSHDLQRRIESLCLQNYPTEEIAALLRQEKSQ